jgi:hypothetical protein
MWIHKKFALVGQLVDMLNGVLVGSVNLHEDGADIDGKTIIIDVGAGDVTVTFAPALGRNWTLEEIVTAINAHVSLPSNTAKAYLTEYNRAGSSADRRLSLSTDSGCIVRSTGTANTDLGLSAVSDTEQLITAEAAVKSINFDESERVYTILMYQ